MSSDVLQNSAPLVWADPQTRWASATVSVLDGTGTALEAPTATVDPVSTTVASASSAYSLTLTSGTGVAAGVPYLVTDAGFGARVVVVASIDGAAVTLAEALPSTPSAGATWQGLRVSATLTTTSTATLGESLRAVFAGPAGEQATSWFSVVRQVMPPACTERDVRNMLAHGYSSAGILREPQSMRDVATMASQLVRDRLKRAGVWPHLVGDPAPLGECGRYAARVILAEERGLVPQNRDPDAYVQHVSRRLDEALGGMVHSIAAVDTDEDGDFDDQTSPVFQSIVTER